MSSGKNDSNWSLSVLSHERGNSERKRRMVLGGAVFVFWIACAVAAFVVFQLGDRNVSPGVAGLPRDVPNPEVTAVETKDEETAPVLSSPVVEAAPAMDEPIRIDRVFLIPEKTP